MTDVSRDIFRDAYHYYDKYERMKMTAEDFVSAARDMADYSKKHGDTLLAIDLFSAIYTHLGERWKAERKEEARHAEQIRINLAQQEV